MPPRKSQRGRLRSISIFVVLCIALSLAITPLAFTAEKTVATANKKTEKKKPQDAWNVYQHDYRHSGQGSGKGPVKPGILWVIPFGDTGKPSTPMAIAKDGKAYVGVLVAPKENTSTTEKTESGKEAAGGHSGVFAFVNGKKVQWVSSEKGEVLGPLAIGKDGTIYAVIGTDLVAIDKKDGSTNWKIKLNGISTGGVMLGPDGTLYVGTLAGKTMYAVSSEGAVKWRYVADGPIDSSPAIGSDGSLYFTAQDLTLYGLTSAGALKWKYRVPTEETTDISSPALSKDDIVYFTGTRYEGSKGAESLFAVNPDGKLKWSFESQGKKMTMPSVADDGSIVFGTTTLNYTEDRSLTIGEARIQSVGTDGQERWSFNVRDDDFLGALLIDGEGNVFSSSPDWFLTCMTKSGTMRWRAKVGGLMSMGPDGVIYISANSSVAGVIDKDVRGSSTGKKTAKQEQDGFNVGGSASLLVYLLPIIIAIGIGYLLKSRIGAKEEGDEHPHEDI